MSWVSLFKRYCELSAEDRGYYRRRLIDLKIHSRSSFSQFGEDANAMELFRTVGRKQLTYLDIGANDPKIHSNTYLFYRNGSSGVLVDANPSICRRLRRTRPRDTVIHTAVAATSGPDMDLRVMNLDGLSTLSEERVRQLEIGKFATQIGTFRVPVIGINDLLSKTYVDRAPDFATIDIEGFDFPVIEAWDFDRWRPLMLCVESGVLSKGKFQKDRRFGDLLRTRRYVPMFETFANTMYIDEDRW